MVTTRGGVFSPTNRGNAQVMPLQTLRVLGKIKAILLETIVAIEAVLFWALVVLVASFLWLGDGLLGLIAALRITRCSVSSPRAAREEVAGLSHASTWRSEPR
jgi:hypothetical protein